VNRSGILLRNSAVDENERFWTISRKSKQAILQESSMQTDDERGQKIRSQAGMSLSKGCLPWRASGDKKTINGYEKTRMKDDN